MFHATPPVKKNELPLRGRTPEGSIDNVERVVCVGARYMGGAGIVLWSGNLNVPQS